MAPRSTSSTEGAGTLRLVLGDQLSKDLSAISGADPRTDRILMCEVADEAT